VVYAEKEVLLCLGEMEQDPLRGVVRELEEVWVEGEEAVVGWGEPELEQVRVGIASALAVELLCLIRQVLLVTT
jgi:hypothetical protein